MANHSSTKAARESEISLILTVLEEYRAYLEGGHGTV